MGKRIVVVGAGAIGGYAGGHMTRAGHEVTLAIQQRDPERDGRLAERLRHERFALLRDNY